MTLPITAQTGMWACGQPVRFTALSSPENPEVRWVVLAWQDKILPATLNSQLIWNQGLELVCSETPRTDSPGPSWLSFPWDSSYRSPGDNTRRDLVQEAENLLWHLSKLLIQSEPRLCNLQNGNNSTCPACLSGLLGGWAKEVNMSFWRSDEKVGGF